MDRTIGQWMAHTQAQAGLQRLSAVSESLCQGLQSLAQQADQPGASADQSLQVRSSITSCELSVWVRPQTLQKEGLECLCTRNSVSIKLYPSS